MIVKNIRASLARSICVFIKISLTFITKYTLITISAFWICQARLKSINWFTLYKYIRWLVQPLVTFLSCYIRAIIALECCCIAIAALLDNLFSLLLCYSVKWVVLRRSETCLALPTFIYDLIGEAAGNINW